MFYANGDKGKASKMSEPKTAELVLGKTAAKIKLKSARFGFITL